MTDAPDPHSVFSLDHFLPYLLNQAAELTSEAFHEYYQAEFDLTRTQWRVVANLGRFGTMTAADICRVSHIEKTAVSRAVSVLERREMLQRQRSETDRRQEVLILTRQGLEVFHSLGQRAIDYDNRLRQTLGPHGAAQLETMLRALIHRPGPDQID